MGGGGEQKTVQTSTPSNPDVNPTISRLLQGVQGTYGSTSAAGTPAAMTSGWASQLSAANNPDYASGVNGAIKDFADVAAGNRFGQDDPGYAAVRQGAIDDTLTNVNSSFLTDGRFGSTVQGEAAGRGVSQTIAGLDYGNQQQDIARQQAAAQMLPSMFAAGQSPGAVQTAVGQQQREAPWYNLGQASAIASGNYGAGGSTSTQTQPGAPWWQAPVAIGGTLAGAFF